MRSLFKSTIAAAVMVAVAAPSVALAHGNRQRQMERAYERGYSQGYDRAYEDDDRDDYYRAAAYRRDDDRYDRRDRGLHRGWYKPQRADRVYYLNDRPYYYTPRGQVFDSYGREYRGYVRCDKGTEGLVIGGMAGGTIGYALARGDRALGVILGAAAGALAGRAIDRADSRCGR